MSLWTLLERDALTVRMVYTSHSPAVQPLVRVDVGARDHLEVVVNKPEPAVNVDVKNMPRMGVRVTISIASKCIQSGAASVHLWTLRTR